MLLFDWLRDDSGCLQNGGGFLAFVRVFGVGEKDLVILLLSFERLVDLY